MVPIEVSQRLKSLRFFVGFIALLLVAFAVMRAALMWWTWSAGVATPAQLRSSFIVGARFDLATACFITLPLILACYLPWTSPARGPRTRRWFLWTVSVVIGLLLFLLLCEFEFFREFQTRFNQLAIRYLNEPKIVGGMVWYNYPVVRFVLASVVAAALFHLGLRLVLRWAYPASVEVASAGDDNVPATSQTAPPMSRARRIGTDVGVIAAIVAISVISIRGGFQDEPLRWGDAFKGTSEFANQMSVNGLYSLTNAIVDMFIRGDDTKRWTGGVGTKDVDGNGVRDSADGLAEARRLTQSMILAPGEHLLDPDHRTALRIGNPGSRLTLKTADGRPANVVMVLMEGFSARYVGACGAKRSFTPHFDALAKDGTLFDHAFSAGTHTHQGIFASQLGFPNLPGYESLMESAAGNQPFLSAAEIFRRRGYKTFFLYNGQFFWDNMNGFFRKQGVQTFIGRPEMEADAKYVDPVWGVSDGDVFDHANRAFDEASKDGPFFATVLTLSNHVPFLVPTEPGLDKVTDQGDMNDRLTAMSYADWAVGHFIEEAKTHAYFKNTLFVFVGDHGFHVPPVLTELHLLYHHVPMVYYAPGLVATSDKNEPLPTGLAGVVDHRVATHMNMIPSILGLLGIADAPQSAWGRSLFNDSFPDHNFAIIKNTGGGRVVGLLRDDKLMILGSAGGKPLLLRYSIGDNPTIEAIDDPALRAEMEPELRAYIRVGLDDLLQHRAGPIEPKSAAK